MHEKCKNTWPNYYTRAVNIFPIDIKILREQNRNEDNLSDWNIRVCERKTNKQRVID